MLVIAARVAKFSEPVNMDQLKKFMREIMVRGWVAITLSSHIPYCTPIQ